MFSFSMDLVGMIESVKRRVEAQLPVIGEEIDGIIGGRVVSVVRIERLLDTLLDYALIGCGEEEFKRLNGYYATVHKENSEIYDGFWNDGIF